jgi:esterase/lipase superfamily enzyme
MNREYHKGYSSELHRDMAMAHRALDSLRSAHPGTSGPAQKPDA